MALGVPTLCTSTMFPSQGRSGAPSPPLFPEEPLDIPEVSAAPPASSHTSSGLPLPHDWDIAVGAASSSTPTHQFTQAEGATSFSADFALGTSQQHLWTAPYTGPDQEYFSTSMAAATSSCGVESACPGLGGFEDSCPVAGEAAASSAPDAQGFRRRKPKAYQWSPQTDPEMEDKRQRALKAFKARQKKEQEERKLRMRTQAVKSEIDQLRNEISEREKKIAELMDQLRPFHRPEDPEAS